MSKTLFYITIKIFKTEGKRLKKIYREIKEIFIKILF